MEYLPTSVNQAEQKAENEVIINTNIDGFESTSSLVPEVTTHVKIVFHLGQDYPNKFPQMSIFSGSLDREAISRVKSKVLQDSANLLGEPMLISLISSVKEYLQLELESIHTMARMSNDVQRSCDKSNSDKIWTTILHIDHMRSKNKYCKTLEKWASELTLCGKILFCNKLIIVLLQGDIQNIKDFIVRLKTVSVDVDSKGHSCKERMMTVLCEQQHKISDINRLKDFEKKELASRDQLETIFMEAGLISLYKEHVMKLH
ncbi:RWD domain-containing protein 3-like isoform X2 [Mercenaria mercenaria]|uniref:RWD domain-containing protein 3-like isoform X2 n=1 Tax=Mercenaria mercenaria TaxID=6596 RepID=UPI00234F61DF|nr:RWD domain-containing protein 3-like isoform X2 [Mercenaria mercenaria]